MEYPNLKYFEALAAGDKDFLLRLTHILKEELPLDCRAYETAFAKGDLEVARQHVHKLKHKIGILGLDQGHALANEYEEDLRKGKASHAPAFAELLEKMQRFLDTLP